MFIIVLLFSFLSLFNPISSILLCDSSDSSHLLRVIGGKPATQSEFPWQAVLVSYNAEGYGMMCGATIVEEYWALTAAHCIIPSTVHSYLLVGVSSLSNPAHTIRVVQHVVHPQYDEEAISNDIALVKSSSSLLLPHTQRVCLTSDDSSFVEGVVTGFGAHNDGALSVRLAPSNVILSTDVPIIPTKKCAKEWESLSMGAVSISNNQLCAGSKLHGTSQGDSGGPLLVKDAFGRSIQVGITSFGASGLRGTLDQTTFPGVYTRVSSYIPWIESVTSAHATLWIMPNIIVLLVLVL